MNQTLRAVLPIGVLLLGIGGAVAMFKLRSKPKRAQKAHLPPLVETDTIEASEERVRVVAMGTVLPAQEIEVRSEVSGRLASVSKNLVPGGRIKKGETLVRIDSRQYQLALEERAANVKRAQVDLALEKGRQRVAAREWQLIGGKDKGAAGRDLALRKPQLQSAEAALAAAQSGLERAQLDIDRTVIRAPFNAIVKTEMVDRGQLVTPQMNIARLMGSDRFWVQVSVPMSQLGWIAIPGVNGEQGSSAQVIQEIGGGRRIERAGHVVRLLGDLDPKGRMARLLVEIDRPLEGEMPLLIGAYVRVEVEGRTLDRVFVIPRTALRGERSVWLMDGEGTLRIRTVEIAWRGTDSVYLSAGVNVGDRLIVSRLSAPVEGMKLRIDGPAATPPQAKRPGSETGEGRP